ncbi:HET-domain-containing protein [Lophiostoma macrostomum CBS 122681]|uniref:HET-domain-containing protein n=1 Tax=Lophiostoma macrostomum CBS 122681 TaxID=1314788 RepID=A0A6A6THE7_9PLEO|nr:HET-domain-containing protein [Lophiostoma macrostomum CBS 122681]
MDIPLSSLSANFQHAILATAELGFSYLWIDSLCIIQGNREDWQREARRMGDVYRHSTCNLSAAYADPTRGFLFEDQSRDVNLPSVHNPKNGRTYILSEKTPWLHIWNAPLFERAWVFQEQILAPRALHFGQDQMFWECKARFANEVWPTGWSDEPRKPFGWAWGYSRSRAGYQPFWQFSVQRPRTSKEKQSLFMTWYLIVTNYSHRKLTFASDRVPAIEGIASEFSECFPDDQYLFGLWKLDLHRGLLWAAPKSAETPRDRPHWDKVPSWSWASIDVPVGFEGDRLFQDGKSLSHIEYDHECEQGPSLRIKRKTTEIQRDQARSFGLS